MKLFSCDASLFLDLFFFDNVGGSNSYSAWQRMVDAVKVCYHSIYIYIYMVFEFIYIYLVAHKGCYLLSQLVKLKEMKLVFMI